MANVEMLPQLQPDFSDTGFDQIPVDAANRSEAIHQYAAHLIEAGKINEAWQALLRS
ncbi:hypothetical protein LWM68_11570 [Niabella sp. W65]|nr:hypothetical protein [Niabella sp. W65]MCH7363333.1 hypothetical protein [Niabella sp. W65]